ncbi:MAG: M67 family metallopeptidase [Microcoleaceae cyanobacterium]
MSILQVSPQLLNQICTHAEQAYPNECCGILMGYLEAEDRKSLVEIIPTENAWNQETADHFELLETTHQQLTTTERRYTIAPEALLNAQKQGRDRQLSIIGIYHSHPDHTAIPSEFDRVCAWLGYSYIIVSVQQKKAADLRSWCLDQQHQFIAEEIVSIAENK